MLASSPYPGIEARHLHVLRKVAADSRSDSRAGRASHASDPSVTDPTGPRASVTTTMGTVYAIANQKGGVGKTTTAVNLAACVAEAGYETLLIDIDPQCNATLGLGLPKDRERTVYDVLLGEATLQEVIEPSGIEHLAVAPASPDLAGATVELPRVAGSEGRLREALDPIRARYAFVLLDCPPSLGTADGERPRGGGAGDRSRAGRVLRARGPRRPARHPVAHSARAQPAPGRWRGCC